MVIKGLKIIVCICMALFLAPFNVYADTLIVPTYSSSSEQSEWQSKLTVTNYCDGSNTQASCKLTFTLNDDYYGFVMFNAYNNNTQIYTNQYIYIAGGIGEYNYLFYQNGVKPITNIEITYVELFLRGSNVDLTDVIQLLTLINSSNQAIYSNSVTIRNNLISVLNEEIEANGYLEYLTKYKQWNFPLESMPLVVYPLITYDVYGINQYNNYYLPIFKIQNDFIMGRLLATRDTYYIIFATDLNIANYGTGNDYSLEKYIVIPDGVTINNFELLYNSFPLNTFQGKLIRLTFTYTGNTYLYWKFQNISGDHYYMPLYYGSTSNKLISTEFALQFGLSNSFLDNINIIANGTSATQTAAQSSDSANSQLQQDTSTLFQQEDSFKSNMQSAMQNVPQFNVNTFGTKFMNSAQWVRTQYERMTNNTPFQQLITFSLLVGLSMILIGKVRK